MGCFHVVMVAYWVTCTFSVSVGNGLLRRDSGEEIKKIVADSEKWAYGRGAANTGAPRTSHGNTDTAKAHSIDSSHEKQLLSQNGEDGILERLCGIVGCKSKTYVEFGALDAECTECNARHLRDMGWKGLMMGQTENLDINLRKEQVSMDNVVELFQKYGVPQDFDVLSIDVEGIDFYVLRSILCSSQFNPKIIAVEYNAHIPATRGAFVTPLTTGHKQSECTGYCNGMSLGALKELGNKFGYELIYAMSVGVNAFLARRDALPSDFEVPELYTLDRPFAYKEMGAEAWLKAQPRWENLAESMLLKDCAAPKVTGIAVIAGIMSSDYTDTQSQNENINTQAQSGRGQKTPRLTSVYTDGKHEWLLAQDKTQGEELNEEHEQSRENQTVLEQGLHHLVEMVSGR